MQKPAILLKSNTLTKLCILLYLSINTVCLAQPNNTQQQIDQLNLKVTYLEHQKDNLDTQTDLLNQRVETIKGNLDNRFDKKALELDKTTKTSWAAILLGILGGIGGLIAIFLSLKKYIATQAMQLASEKIEKEVAELIKVNKSQLTQLIEAHDLETKLKKQTHILVITETADSKQQLTEFFAKVGMSNVTYRLNEPYSVPESTIDLILFDDHNNTKTQHDLFKQYIESAAINRNLVFVFYGVFFDYSKESVNFSNSKFTLYNQLINSLTYQHLIQKDSSV